MCGLPAQRCRARRHSCSSRAWIGVGADGLFQGDDQAGADRFDDGGGAALLAGDRVVEVAVLVRADERDGAAAGDGGHPVADQVPADDEDARGLRAADELVRRQEHRVLAVAGTRRGFGHPDRHVRAGGGVVPERQRAVGVQQGRDRVGVGEDAGDVRGGREAADAQRPVGVADELCCQVGEVDVAVASAPITTRRRWTRARAVRWSGARTGRRTPPAARSGGMRSSSP